MKYHVARDGQQIGVYREYEVRDGLRKGELRTSDLYWREDMPEWLPLSSAPDLMDTDSSHNPYAPPSADLSLDSGGSRDGVVLATLAQRARATLMDVSCGAVCLGFTIIGGEMVDASGKPTALGDSLMAVGGLTALVILIWNLTMLATRGQTIGKQWMNIRIANFQDGGNPGFVKAVLLRWLCSGLLGAVPVLGLIYAVTDVGFIFRPDRRCLHDLLADTNVVQGSLPRR